MPKTIAIIGGGNMGLSFAKGLLENKLVTQDSLFIYEISPEQCENIFQATKIKAKQVIDSDLQKAEAVILAIKPQSFENTIASLTTHLTKQQLLISIMAGVSVERIAKHFTVPVNIVRAMPNLPASIGAGMTVFFSNNSGAVQVNVLASEIFQAVGQVLQVNNEAMIDSATAISGSGPAYFFYFVEALINSAQGLGFDKQSATKLVLETMQGASHLLRDGEASDLRKRVTSKGGTTEAALAVFDQANFANIITLAVNKALERAKVLAKS